VGCIGVFYSALKNSEPDMADKAAALGLDVCADTVNNLGLQKSSVHIMRDCLRA
jgi:hypothetical protein